MALVSILDELKRAEKGGYAIPCFDTFEMMGTQGIFDALEAQRAPGIVGLYSGMLDRPYAMPFCAMVRAMAEDATVPVSIILDHGADFEHCMKALHYGFSDVMYDGSKLPFEENIANTQLVVRAAHAVGAAVEAELGHVGTGRDYQSFGAQGKGFTEPAAVVEFVEKTGVDCLAVAVGTAHGWYDGEPRLAIDLLQKIRASVEIPLALHGGSGLSDDQFRAAIGAGISKINIFTNLAMAAGEHMLKAAQVEERAYFNIVRTIPEAFQGECERLLHVFGTVGKA
jgi:fructose-bisphosphate aldolase class II